MKKIAILFFLCLSLAYGQDLPPSITLEGDQLYCGEAPMPIATNVTLTAPNAGNNIWEEIVIQISQGYAQGEDLLVLSGNHPDITASWSEDEGELTLAGPATFEAFEAAIADVLFETEAGASAEDKFFSVNLGNANFLPSTGHYYLYVSSLGITWTDARDQAAAMDYFGLQGYLVTIRSEEEAQLTGEQAPGTGWIGATDVETEGTWKWVTGPEEGLEFYDQNTGLPINDEFNFWNIGEPNNFGGEDYAHITDPSIGELGSWNDLPNVLTNPGDPYYPKGYIVEFGGMPGDDSSLALSGSTRIVMPRLEANEVSICSQGEVNLILNSNADTIDWYLTATSENPIHTGFEYTTDINGTTIFWVIPLFNGCTNGNRVPVTAQALTLPIANDVLISQCADNTSNGNTVVFNLNQYTNEITGGASDREVTFYTDETLTDEIVNGIYENTVNGQTLYVEVVNTITMCRNTSEITLETNTAADLNLAYVYACNDSQETGITSFDLSEADDQFFDGITVGLEYSYYETYEDALQGVNPLPLNYTNTTPFNQTIIARLDANGSCYGISEVFLEVLPLPQVELIDVPIYCLNTFPETITLSGGVENDNPSNYYYNWSTGETTSTIEVNEVGVYNVEVTSVAGCSRLRTITVMASNTATIDEVIVEDISPNNTITAIVSGEGEYEYALDGGNYQTSNVFENVPAGVYTLYVKDVEGDCGITTEDVFVIGYPKVMTPNDDGVNDVWSLKGIAPEARQFTNVKIYDRFGKLLRILWSFNDAWDGTYNGVVMPSDDYWFVATLQDGRTITGHFALRR